MKLPPQIALVFEVDGRVLGFKLKHIGTELVQDLKVTFNRPVTGTKYQVGQRMLHKRIDRLSLFTSRMFMYPEQEFEGFVNDFRNYIERKQPLKFDTLTEYTTHSPGKQQYKLEHKLHIWLDLPQVRKT